MHSGNDSLIALTSKPCQGIEGRMLAGLSQNCAKDHSSTVGRNEFQHPEVFKYWHKCSLYWHFPSCVIFSPGWRVLSSILPQRQLWVPPASTHTPCSICGTALSHSTADVVVSSNIFDEESLPSVNIKDECDFWRLWECHGTELFQTESYYWRLCVGLGVKHEFVFYKRASPALTCQILTSGS